MLVLVLLKLLAALTVIISIVIILAVPYLIDVYQREKRKGFNVN